MGLSADAPRLRIDVESFLISTRRMVIALAATWPRPTWRSFGPPASLFGLVEMGDKTQIATAALAVRFQTLPLVVAGSTLGMMLVNGPSVLLGEAVSRKRPLNHIRMVAAAGSALTGIWILLIP